MTEEKTINIPSLSPASYLLQKGNPDGRLIILCHGFLSTNKRMWNRFQHRLPESFNILAPNSPFPIPSLKEDGWQIGYSWFFYDNIKNYYFIDYEICKAYMASLVKELGFANNPKTIVGFSQGGYASVHMAEALDNVDHIIGIGCKFKIKEPKWSQPLRVDALHGESDETVDLAGAQEHFSALPKEAQGRFQSFPGVEHKPSVEMLEIASRWIVEK